MTVKEARTLLNVGDLIECRVCGRTRICKILDIRPQTGHMIKNSNYLDYKIEPVDGGTFISANNGKDLGPIHSIENNRIIRKVEKSGVWISYEMEGKWIYKRGA